MKALILAYHSHNISGDTYATNDHVALQSDLETLATSGIRVASLEEIGLAVHDRRIDGRGEAVVGISFDDGPIFDFADFVHDRFGPQRSFVNIVRQFERRIPGITATSFVIASAEARGCMESSPTCGFPQMRGWLADDWWKSASDSGLLRIENHSWDHVHHAVRHVCLHSEVRDDFRAVNNYALADVQIRRAGETIGARAGRPCRLFAYPYGHTNDYLLHDYLPGRAPEHGIVAAFGASGGMIGPGTSAWDIPRNVCGHHWSSPEDFDRMLRRLSSRPVALIEPSCG